MQPDISNIEKLIDEQKRINAVRKQMYPGWPTHKQTMMTPDGILHLMSECVPIKRLDIKKYCKYCFSDHSNWWLMDDNDYNLPLFDDKRTIILCGDCEHTSVSE